MKFNVPSAAVLLAACALSPIVATCSFDADAGAQSASAAVAATASHDSHVTSGAVGRASGSLEGAAASPRELVAHVLDAIVERDTAALVSMLVDADEYAEIVYPELGAHYAAARDTRIETRQFLWEHQRLDALKGMRSALRELGGRRLTFVTVEFTEGEKRFPSYRLMEGAVVSVTEADGAPATLHMLGTLIEKDGRYKLLSYRDLD